MTINFKNIIILGLIISNGIFIYFFYKQDSQVKKIFNETAGEPYTDLNGNGQWDNGETYTDLNGNDQYDKSRREYIEEFYIDVVMSEKRIRIDGDLNQELFYFESGQVKEEKNYSNDKLHGTCKLYYENEYIDDPLQLEKEMKYNNGNLIEAILYYDNGERKQLIEADSQMKNYYHEINYYPNGQRASEGMKFQPENGKNKLLYGNWIWYDEDGVIKQEKTYDVNL